MIEQMNLAGSFTLPGTSMTVNRLGYGAMQLAGRDGSKLVWGPPRNVDEAIAVLQQAVANGVIHIDTADFYGPQHHEPDHTKSAVSLSRRSRNHHQSQRSARRGWVMDSGFFERGIDCAGSRQSSQPRSGRAGCS